jgi:hypothetical protein
LDQGRGGMGSKKQKSENIVERVMGTDVILYERPRSVTPNISYRIKIPGSNNKYERRTTGTNEIGEAREVALERHAEMRYAHKRGFAIQMPTIGDLCKRYLKNWLREFEIEGSITAETYRQKDDKIQKYLVPYFGHIEADCLTQEKLDGYFKWRIKQANRKNTQSRRPENFKTIPYKKFDQRNGEFITLQKKMPITVWAHRVPSKESVRRDHKVLMSVYDWAIYEKLIEQSAKPSLKITNKVNKRRGYFKKGETPIKREPKDWGDQECDPKAILAKLEYDAKKKPFGDDDLGKLKHYLQLEKNRTFQFSKRTKQGYQKRSSYHVFLSKQLYHWAHLMLLSGLRTNEMMYLQHKHVEWDGEDLIFKVVPPRGEKDVKQRKRDVVLSKVHGEFAPLAIWKSYLRFRLEYFVDRVEGVSNIPDDTEYLWLNWHGGKETRHLQQRFKTLLSRPLVNLLYDADNNPLTAYSLRHTYCVNQLYEGVPIYQVARNMGTSVDMIEEHYGWVNDRVAMKKANQDHVKRHRAKRDALYESVAQESIAERYDRPLS